MLAPGFADCFEGADLVVVTDIYAAGEMPRPGVSGELVLNAVVRAHPEAGAVYLPNREDVVAYLRANLRPGDLCLTLAAGDLTNLAAELAARSRGERRPVNAVSKAHRSAEIEKAAELLGPLAERDRPMGELTTYRVGGRAALFSEPGTVADLARLAGAVAASVVAVVVLGKGSNLLVADAGFPGLVRAPRRRFRPHRDRGRSRAGGWRGRLPGPRAAHAPRPASPGSSGRSGYRAQSAARSG